MHGAAGTSHNKAMSDATRYNIVMGGRHVAKCANARAGCDFMRSAQEGSRAWGGQIVAVVTMLAQVAPTICPRGKRKIARVGIAPAGIEDRDVGAMSTLRLRVMR